MHHNQGTINETFIVMNLFRKYVWISLIGRGLYFDKSLIPINIKCMFCSLKPAFIALKAFALILLNTQWYNAYNFDFTKMNKYVLYLTFEIFENLFLYALINSLKYY